LRLTLTYMPYNFGLHFFAKEDNPWYNPNIVHYYSSYKPWNMRFDPEEKPKYNAIFNSENAYAPFHYGNNCDAQIELVELWWKYCNKTSIFKETNRRAKNFAHKAMFYNKVNLNTMPYYYKWNY